MTDRQRELYETQYKPAYDAFIAVYPFTLDDLPDERWKWIPDYEERYMESTYGRTKSFLGKEPKILKPYLHESGHIYVILYDMNRKRRHYQIQRLVALTFIPNPLRLPEVHHFDNNKLNNHILNLYWVTSAQNIHYAQQDGIRKKSAWQKPKYKWPHRKFPKRSR